MTRKQKRQLHTGYPGGQHLNGGTETGYKPKQRAGSNKGYFSMVGKTSFYLQAEEPEGRETLKVLEKVGERIDRTRTRGR